MTNANAISSVLASYPIGNHTDEAFRGLLILAQKLAVQLGTNGTGNSPAQITLDFLAAQLDDTHLVEKARAELNFLVERYARGA